MARKKKEVYHVKLLTEGKKNSKRLITGWIARMVSA